MTKKIIKNIKISKKAKEKILKWIYFHHYHHKFCDQKIPKGQYGCEEKNSPYVNSLKLERLIKSLNIKKNEKNTL